ncbi:uncharacterized protein LOC135134832 [Zophobas morio]|uniref:uncharacterized protein LOC135134832 n=1 Tax=Zophobas morio TaxID=2755281 RepID=UPI0030833C17
MEVEVKDYLDKWGLAHLWESFQEQGVDFAAFINLTEDLIKELIPKIGDRAKFLSHFKRLKTDICIVDIESSDGPSTSKRNHSVSDLNFISRPLYNLENSLSPASTTSLNSLAVDENPILSDASFTSICSTPSQSSTPLNEIISKEYEDFFQDKALDFVPVPYKRQNAFIGNPTVGDEPITYDFDLKKCLKKSVKGRQLLQTKSSETSLTPTLQNNLVSIIIEEELRTHLDKRIPSRRFIQLARYIKQLFPKERIETYYTPYVNVDGKYKKCARGKLFDKYHNTRRTLRQSGILETKGNSSKTSEEELSAEDDNYENIVQWLKNNYEPWPQVIEHWKETSKTRLKKYNESQSTIFEYLTTFPGLKRPLGYTLFEVDFQKLFPNQEYNLYAKINDFVVKILSLAKNSKDVNVKHYLEKLSESQSEDATNALALLILPHLVQTSVISSTSQSNPKKKIRWRPSKTECQETFLLHVPTADEVKVVLEQQRNKFLNKCDTFQPLPIVVGNFEN